MISEQNWHNLEVAEGIQSLASTKNGLSQEEAKARLAKFGPNELEEKGKISPLVIFLEQFKSILIIILLVAVVVSAAIGEVVDAIVIFTIVVACAGLGFIQEYRAERSMEALKKMAAPTASVLRDGIEIEIPARELVPGDVILLRAGDRIPADSRLVEAINLRLDEAPLTGESTPVEKTTAVIPEKEVPVGDRKNMVFTGTAATYGRGTAMVVATGMATEFGKIAAMLQVVEEKRTPLQVGLDRVGKWLGIICLTICALVALLGVIRGHEILEMFIWGVSLAVAAVPEALPAVVTISLAIGVQRMVKRHALIRRLPSVETLGCTTVICSDKTGTLTQDQMTVRKIYVNGQMIDVTGVGYEPKGEFYIDGRVLDHQKDDHLQTLLRINTLCNDTRLTNLNGVWNVKGDPTEGALVVTAAKGGIQQDELNNQFPRLDELPFSSERKKMTTIHATPEGKRAYIKGAPEIILDSCSYVYMDGQERELSEKERENILEVARQMAESALRVLGMAYKPLPDIIESREDAERDMTFVGLAGMIDPPREEVKGAIRLCERAGIKSVMITGDHKLTAMAVASELGLLKGGLALSGAELDKLSDEEFQEIVEKVEVYARVSPAHKMRVIEAFSRRGEIVAMTGDGVNDAPALKQANIGVAMGITGTDVTKEASDMILTDDNFASIVAAVEEGRGIFGNIKKYLMFLLSCNAGEIAIMLVASLFGFALPVIAIHLLWINLTTDGLPALALALDPADPDIMEQPPRNPKESIFTRSILLIIGLVAVIMVVTIMPVFLWTLNSGAALIKAQTMVFTMIAMFEVFIVFTLRSERHSIFKLGLFSNKWLVFAVIFSVLMQLAVVYVPFLQGAFHTVALSLRDWAIILPIALTGFIAIELAKIIASLRRRRAQNH